MFRNDPLDLEEILKNFPLAPTSLPASKEESTTSSDSTTLQMYKKLYAAILNEDITSPLFNNPDPKVLNHEYLSTLTAALLDEPKKPTRKRTELMSLAKELGPFYLRPANKPKKKIKKSATIQPSL